MKSDMTKKGPDRGDKVTIDAEEKKLSVDLSEAELIKRQNAWVKPELRTKRGVLAKYARTVTSASTGAVTS